MIRHIETSHRHQKMGSKSSVNFLEVTINGTTSNSCLISCFYNISDTQVLIACARKGSIVCY